METNKSQPIQVSTKNEGDRELEVAQIVKDLLQRNKIPIFTNKIIVESKVRSHSHPVLTINTYTTDPLLVLQTLIHEQLHWFVTDHPKHDEAITYLKEHYQDNGECNVSGTHPNSFWEHIIVCFNTANILKGLVSPEEMSYIKEQAQHYPKTEKMVQDNNQKIEQELENFNMVVKDFKL